MDAVNDIEFEEIGYSTSIEVFIPGIPSRWDKMYAKVKVLPGQHLETILDITKNRLEKWHRLRNAELYVDVIYESQRGTKVITIEEAPYGNTGSIVDDINSCTDLKVLESYKFIAKSKKEYQEAYDKQYSRILSEKSN